VSFTEAAHQVCDEVLDNLDGKRPDVALAFVSSHHAPSYYSAPEVISERLGTKVLVGCSAAGVIGGGREIERRPGVALTAASLPGVNLTPFILQQDELPGPDDPPEAWEELIGVESKNCPAILLLPDPFTIQTDQLIAGLDFAFAKAVKIGGLVSGGNGPGTNALFEGGSTKRSGAVGVAFCGDLAVETVVAQGCRPIGRPMVVTECERNIIRKLEGETPLDVIRELFEKAEQRDRRLIRRSLQIGIVMDPLRDEFTAGDFLIRNVIGADDQDGAIAAGELIREGQVVQFHVRDAEAADEDLRAMLEKCVERLEGDEPAAALLFQCLGRGQHLFGAPDHDTDLFRDMVAPVPLAGFFCNGEIGPVGGTTFLHGYTSSFALFRPKRTATAK
jgi:small ligand-binding sensory domain FIST